MTPNYLNHRGGGIQLPKNPVFRKGDQIRYPLPSGHQPPYERGTITYSNYYGFAITFEDESIGWLSGDGVGVIEHEPWTWAGWNLRG